MSFQSTKLAFVFPRVTNSIATLVLNKAWQADRIVSWRNAMRLITSGRAEMVECHDGKVIRTVSRVYDMPAVIRMLTGRITSGNKVRLNKHNLWCRDKGRCQYCDQALPKTSMTYDHVMPKSRGGKTTWGNIVLSCVSCNQKKGNRTPTEAGMRLAIEPRAPAKTQMIRSASQGVEAWMRYCGEK